MTRATFDSIAVHSGNTQAVQLCQAIADMRLRSRPVFIYGERGSGKSSLLTAVVHHASARHSGVPLFGATPKNTPDEVSHLMTAAAGLPEGRQAILLLDDLEGFAHSTDVLEKLVTLFAVKNHTILLCSNVHPDELHNLTRGLRSIIARSVIARIEARPLEGKSSLDAEKAFLENQVASFRALLDYARTDALRARGEADVLIERTEQLASQVKAERTRVASLDEQYRRKAGEVEILVAQQHQVASELGTAREQYQEMQGQLERAAEERIKLESLLKDAQAEARENEKRLATVREERDGLAATARALQETQKKLGLQLEEALIRYARLKDREARQAAASEAGRELAAMKESMTRLEAERSALARSVQRLDAELKGTRDESVQARRQVDAFARMVEQLRNEVETLRKERERGREAVGKLTRHVDVLLARVASERERFRRLREDHDVRGREIELLREKNARKDVELQLAFSDREMLGAYVESLLDELNRKQRQMVDLELQNAILIEDGIVVRGMQRITSAGQSMHESEKTKLTPWNGSRGRLGEILYAKGYVTEEQLADTLSRQKDRHQRLGGMLIESGYTNEAHVAEAVASQLDLPFVRLQELAPREEALRACGKKVAELYKCFPVDISEQEVTVAMCEPTNLVAIDELERFTNRRVKIVVAPKSDIENAYQEFFAA